MGLRLKELRKGKGWSQTQAAEEAGVATSTASRHEHEIGVNFLDMQMWCEVYGCTMAELLTGPHLLTTREKEVVYGLRRLRQNQIDAILSTMAAMVGNGEDESGSDDELNPDDGLAQ